MTVSELRTLVDNLEEYIHVPGGIDRLKKMVLHLAVTGQLVPQDPSEGTGDDLYREIQTEKAELVKQGEIRKGKTLPEISEDEIPFEIPRSWRWTRVSDLGYSLGQKVPDKDFYYVDVASIDNGYQRLKQPSVLMAKDAPSRARKIVKKGTVIYSTVRPYLLNTTIIEGELDKELIASTAFAILHPFVGVDPRWLLRNLTSNYFTDYTNRKSVGMAYPAINDAQFSMAIMPLIPYAEQKRIIAKIESIFTLIDQLAKVYKSEQAEHSKLVASSLAQLAKAENDVKDSLALTHLSEIIRTKADAKILRQTILHLAVSGQLVPQNPSEGTGEELYRQIQAEKAELVEQGKIKKHPTLSEVGDDEIPYTIPTSWKWVRQADIFDITSSKRVMQSDWKKSGIPFLRARDLTAAIKTNEISSDIFVSQEYFDSVKKISGVPQPGDLMVSGVGTIGTPYIVKDGDEFYFKDATILWFKNFSNVSSKFMKQVLLSSYMKKKVKSQSQGTTVDTYTIANARKNIVPLPPLAEQNRIVTKTTQLLDLVSELEKHLEK